MKKQKAINWQNISEGVLTANEISLLEDKRQPISLNLLKVAPPSSGTTVSTVMADIQIVPSKGPVYNVINRLAGSPGVRVNNKPYRYLSCAVRRAVKEYKTALRSGQWNILTK